MKRKVYIKLPDEAKGGGDPKKCGLLRSCLNGVRDAGHNFEGKLGQKAYSVRVQKGKILAGGLPQQGKGSSCIPLGRRHRHLGTG
eukprot:7696868-Prorocentrum_lima.AAC.1